MSNSQAIIDRDMSTSLPDWPKQFIKNLPIPGSRYTSAEFFAREWQCMWSRVWLLLGRESEMPNPGDWQREDVGPESFLMVRQRDGSICAFYNVCPHRGNQIVSGDKGHVGGFICRYHSWAFSLDGNLISAPDRDNFPQGDPCGVMNLVPVKCETFAGFIWINMNPNCESLRDFLGPIWDDWSRYEIEKWKRYLAYTTHLPVNWKVVLDNFNESYHVPFVHKITGDPVERARMHSGVDTNYRTTRFDLSNEGHNRMIMRGGYAGVSLNSDGTIGEPLRSILNEWGVDPDGFAGRPLETRAALQQAKRLRGPARGYSHYQKMTDDQLTDACHYTLFPNFAVSLWSDGFHFLRARPHATDPEKCVFDNWWYASQPPGETSPIRTTVGIVDRNADVQHEVFEMGERSMGRTIDGDVEIFLLQQAGLKSKGFTGGYLSEQENRIMRYHNIIDEYVAGVRPQAGK